jgi:hypothetical protein
MIHRILAAALMVGLLTGSALAADIDRHGSYTEGAGAAAVAKCKNFTGTDDNRSACTDWCSTYTTANAGTSCDCDDGVCPDAPTAAAAPSGPVVSH